jgi:hypothetical protein
MYNIFKPHVVHNEYINKYFVRKYTTFGWAYKDKDSNYWWNRMNEWSSHSTLQEAIKHCDSRIRKVYP